MHIRSALLVLLIGLFGSFQTLAEQWWENPPEDNEQFIYGLGQGNTLAEAQQQALADIAGKLSTKISSSLDRITQDTGVAYSDSVRRQIRSEIRDTELSQFQLVNSKVTKPQTIALIQLSRPKLATLWRNQIIETAGKLDPMLSAHTIADFQQWLALKKALPLAEQNRNLSVKLFALNGLAPGPDLHHLLKKRLAQQPMRVAIKGSLPKLNRALLQQFNQIGFVSCSSNCHLTINYHHSIEHDLMFGEYVSSLNLVYEVLEKKSLIATAEKNVQVTSIASHKSADEGSVSAVVSDLERRGLFQVVGLEI
ncbi:hypothetical protein Rhein_3189 [Rheinheimera sp. A13L]|uniref:LPP20 family lipoprotein n=1 Tax=Rheinheimera sp. A13L TaxID=506534 RepID=UPI00021256A8|nr:LPP20 family lipoprotein [Rheinheimera sp. A13L]EGM76722.1 hypothetical protein Rhein_3189 [Rheinheimera sp. A13L]